MSKKQLTQVSTSDLASELKRRGRHIKTLERRRDRIAAQYDAVEAEIESLGGAAGVAMATGSTGKRRPRNAMNLQDSLAKLLKNKTLGVSDIAEQVQAAGYKTTSANFRTIVNQALLTNPAFKRVSRGKYTVKASHK